MAILLILLYIQYANNIMAIWFNFSFILISILSMIKNHLINRCQFGRLPDHFRWSSRFDWLIFSSDSLNKPSQKQPTIEFDFGRNNRVSHSKWVCRLYVLLLLVFVIEFSKLFQYLSTSSIKVAKRTNEKKNFWSIQAGQSPLFFFRFEKKYFKLIQNELMMMDNFNE